MTRGTLLMILGALVLLSPFLGIPSSWLIRLDVVLGIIIGYFGYSIRTHTTTSRSEVPE
jgi:hypothetical protein